MIVVTTRYFEELHHAPGTNRRLEPLDERLTEVVHQIVPTGRQAKKPVCAEYGIEVDIWIDDNPLFIVAHARV